ncbi:MAG TPA: hypothetical protein VLM38_03170 [Blastocatellia bacterium]|nr:hypothetical protein [Blastocatellia bacterium]
MKSSDLLFTTSWFILLVVSGAIILLSAQSLRIAYTGSQDVLTHGYTLAQIGEQAGEDAAKAFRGRRVTAATWALGYALLAVAVTWIPYRRGERWAWWALLLSLGLSQLLSLARALALVTTAGTAAPAMLLAFVLLGLLAGVPRMFTRRNVTLET